MHDWNTYNLSEVVSYAHGVGPRWNVIFNQSDPDDLRKPSAIVEEAHRLGLQVHGYIFQNDYLYFENDAISELDLWLAKGVDGVFTEFVQSTYDHFMNIESQNKKPKLIPLTKDYIQ